MPVFYVTVTMDLMSVKSVAPGRYVWNIELAILNLISRIGILSIAC